MPIFQDVIDHLGKMKINTHTIDAMFHKDGKEWDTGASKEEKSRHLDQNFKDRIERFKEAAQLNRMKNVWAAPLSVDRAYVPPVHPKTRQQEQFLEGALEGSFVFANLDEKERRALLRAFEATSAAKGAVIIRQGDVGDYFYVLEGGSVGFFVDGEAVGTASPGHAFGELALLYDSPRAATCLAETDCQLWRVDQITFRRILASYSIDKDRETKDLLRKVPFFKDLNDVALTKVAFVLKPATFDKGETIVKRGDDAKMFGIVKTGRLQITDIEVLGGREYDDFEVGPGDYFGEGAIMSDKPIQANVTALEKVEMFTISKENFVEIAGEYSDLIRLSTDIKKLMAMPRPGSKNMLQSHEADFLASMVEERHFYQGHVFFTQDVPSKPCLYLVRNGSVSIEHKVNKSDNTVIEADGYFGNETFANEYWVDETAFLTYTAKAIEDCRVGVLTLETVKKLLAKREEESKIHLEDLEKFSLLGAGSFGRVWLVSNKGSKEEAFALKVQFKRQLIESGQAEGVVRERDIMAMLDHPFVIKLLNSYQDDQNVYMLTKLYLGGELRSLMQSMKHHSMPEWAARFYAAGILEGLSHMHNRKILMRDLKPENVLLDSEGYAVIIDLGFAKVVPDKTFTFCGTPVYIAPEILTQKGHAKGADHWSWAVMLYELLIGVTPFYTDENMSQMDLFKKIVDGYFDFPSGDYISYSAKDLIRRMLIVNPRERLGGVDGGKISCHEWFAEVEWKKLAAKGIKAPWKPTIKDPFDASNFANWDDTKEPEGKRLTEREQKKFKDF